jgi:aminopeptidase N
MRVAPAPISFYGMEYPQVNLLGVELYGRFLGRLELLAAHEVAHQWWYQIVHNDPVNSPWLDEAIAEYSMAYFVETLEGQYDADLFEYNRWWRPLEILVEKDDDAPVDQPVDSYIDGAQYEAIVYGKGALFFGALREELGDRAFRSFLRDYLDDHRYEIVDQEDWEAALESLGNPLVMELYEKWITMEEPR